MDPETPRELERRRQILDAAKKVFADQGFDKARMDDIVSESGLSKGALYWYYKSKNDIIHALIDWVFTHEMAEAADLIEAPGTATQRLRTFVQMMMREYRRFEKMLPLAYEFLALASRNKTVRSSLVGYFIRYCNVLEQLIVQGIERGEFIECAAETVALSIIAMYEGIELLWFLDPNLVDWEKTGEAPLDLVLNGLLKEPL